MVIAHPIGGALLQVQQVSTNTVCEQFVKSNKHLVPYPYYMDRNVNLYKIIIL